MKKIILLFIALILSIGSYAQNRPYYFRVKGMVFDQATHECLAGTNLIIKRLRKGTAANSDGEFSLDSLQQGDTLTASFVGHNTKKIPIDAPVDNLIIYLQGNENNEIIAMIGSYWHNPPKTRTPWPAYSANGQKPEYRPGFYLSGEKNQSTFSTDISHNSYSELQQHIWWKNIPREDIRTEELINCFTYSYPVPTGSSPLSLTQYYTDCPWNEGHRLLMLGLKAGEIPREDYPSSNLVFLIDNSGSMGGPNCLPLLVLSIKALSAQMHDNDRLSVITFGGYSKILLEGVSGKEKEKISRSLDSISASYPSPDQQSIETAYLLAKTHFIPDGNNRIVIASDNLSIWQRFAAEIRKPVFKKYRENIALTILGFRCGAYRSAEMESLAEKAKDSYAYIDNAKEAQRIIVGQLAGPAFILARDMKLQVDFNPAIVAAYRLIGYDYRPTDGDYHNELKNGGDLGLGQTMTAIYEIIPVGVKSRLLPAEDSLHQKKAPEKDFAPTGVTDIAHLTIQYKTPEDSSRKKIKIQIPNTPMPFEKAHSDVRFAAAVIEFSQLLSQNPNKGTSSFEHTLSVAQNAKGADLKGEREEFIQLVRTKANRLPSYFFTKQK